MVGLLLILYHGPEVILITDKLLFNAKKLYTVLDVESSTVKSSAGTFSEFTNYAPRLKAYVESIPEDTLKEFKKKLETQPG